VSESQTTQTSHMEMSDLVPDYGLDYLGLDHLQNVWWNLSTPALYEHALRRYEGRLAHLGALVVTQGQHTGRAAKDKYVVEEDLTKDNIWWGKVNVPFAEDKYDGILDRMRQHLRTKDVFVQDVWACADERYRLPVRVITRNAWQSIFVRNMFRRPPRTPEVLKNFVPSFTVLCCPDFHADPDIDDTRSGTFVALNFKRRLVLIGGTAYAGEMKKSIFTSLNYMLPDDNVLPMHCSANVSKSDPDDVAIFFGLSGTGKTTLSADPKRALVGDDEHGWSDQGVFNFEGGCYAKVINLSPEMEPEIYACTRRFGTVLENVAIDPAVRRLDLDDSSLTENTRASYALPAIPNIVPDSKAGHPRNVIMLTCDAFGVLPPVAKLDSAQAMYHFISGYTAKVAGTEAGVTDPVATFSSCFGAPFMARHPAYYANMLAERLEEHGAACWLVNTGWSGGPHGVGKRMKISITRTLLNAVLDGTLEKASMRVDPLFGFLVPEAVPEVPSDVLTPRSTWSDPKAFDAQAQKLAKLFNENFTQFQTDVTKEVAAAGPKLG